MPSIYWTIDGVTEIEEVTDDHLEELFSGEAIKPIGNVVALDTETSGFFVDGDWQDAPKARVSVVSLAWEEEKPHGCAEGNCSGCNGGYTTSLVSVALPFDQGRVAGKPGKWSDELDDYEVIEGEPCPWNLSIESWRAMLAWLADKRLVMHNEKYDMHIIGAGLREELCCKIMGHTDDCPGAGAVFT